MILGVLKDADNRVAFTPDVVQKLTGVHQVFIERDAGASAFFTDALYTEAGATVATAEEVIQKANLLIRIKPPDEAVLQNLSSGSVVISSFQPYNQPDIAEKLSKYPITVFSMDMLPRTTLAQDKDVLSSMASMAGYRAVLEAATHLPRYFPMLTTAAGSIPPAKVLILGAGVAGLQAIATAKRLGAVVEVFDTRLAVKEEVQSLGAKFVEVAGAKDDKDAGGYAVEQSEEYKQRQQALIVEKSEKADVIITTALLRGKKAPILITKETVEAMKPGSIIVDLAAAGGGNCALTQDNQTVTHQGITIIGDSSLEAKMPMHASQLYAKNIFNFLKILTQDGELALDFDNPLVDGACIVHQGQSRYQIPQST
ncbi:Re/Si-specific NAD(P)(+) transhydrogenase subunit alpha [Tunicatimonas pelagia]|uniref:Re/Si-specific NAD(P)(+) transhydrogenase subunit alpha n=1 Tax=Tunicatimonas pelagia TaxID=931531 RepID=UPI0026650817|nr:Re/Si-specific NAD(P)(+) transhydrogenase subunit alpha [Tunicatimonas pelagia]WKN42023.1 Re/Si-specific NAD(P)(+) transhydrogenase subunit alpha [Tunicatimonas pelagia]